MNSASQPDTPSEWSKFAPLPPRLRSNSESPLTENLAADDSSFQTALSSSQTAVPNSPDPSNNQIALTLPPLDASTPLHSVLEALESAAHVHPTDKFVCQNRKCQDKRERHGKPPRPLFSAQWRAMKIGKRQTLVLDLAVRCPDCEVEHHATLVPPEWLEEHS